MGTSSWPASGRSFGSWNLAHLYLARVNENLHKTEPSSAKRHPANQFLLLHKASSGTYSGLLGCAFGPAPQPAGGLPPPADKHTQTYFSSEIPALATCVQKLKTITRCRTVLHFAWQQRCSLLFGTVTFSPPPNKAVSLADFEISY